MGLEEKKLKRLSFAVFTVLILNLLLLNGCFMNVEETFKVTVIQLYDNSDYRTAQKSLKNSFEELGYKKRIDLKIKNAKGDVDKLNRFVRDISKSETDLVIAVGNEAVYEVKEAELNIPVVFYGAAYPEENGIVSSGGGKNNNITGIACEIPVERIFDILHTVDCGAEALGVIYDCGDSNSKNDAARAKELCELVGMDYYPVFIEETEKTLENIEKLIGTVDAVYMPFSGRAEEIAEAVFDMTVTSGMPVYTNNTDIAEKGAFASVDINYTSLGDQAAHMIVRILGGIPVKNIPPEKAKEYIVSVNCDVAEMLDIDIPDSLENTYIPIAGKELRMQAD